MRETLDVSGSETRSITWYAPPSLGSVRPMAELARLPLFGDLLWTLSVHRVKVRYKQSRLGMLWAVLQPLAMMLVFTLMFSFIGGVPSHGVPYAVFAYAALLPWTAFSSGLASASSALTSHASLLTKVAFPREILPVTYVAAALVDMTTAAGALVALMAWYRVPVGSTIVWSALAVALLALWLLAMGLLISALQVRYRDVGLAMPIMLQVWMFATPVLYPLSAAKHSLSASAYLAYLLNPMAGIVDTFRRGVVLHQAPDAQALLVSAGVIAVVLPASYLYFKFAELTMADVV
jgi:lipopolysaccharide transport system permease protein